MGATTNLTFAFRDELEEVLTRDNISKDDICLVAGASLAIAGIRENNDLDFVIHSRARERLRLTGERKSAGYIVTENTELKENWAGPVGISDDELIDNGEYHTRVNGFKIIRLEIVLPVKYYLHRKLDQEDLILIERHALAAPDWDWGRVTVLPKKKSELVKRPSRFRLKLIAAHRKIFTPREFLKSLFKLLRRYTRRYVDTLLSLIHRFRIGRMAGKEIIVAYPTTKLLAKQFRGEKFNRFDIVVRYLAIEEYFGESKGGFALYNKMQQTRVEKSKPETFKRLIDGVQESSPLGVTSILVDRRFALIDGSHRIALALYLKRDHMAISISHRRYTTHYDKQWFIDNGFSQEEITHIENKAHTIFQTSGLFFQVVLWPPAKDYFNEIVQDMRNDYNVVHVATHNLGDQFNEFAREIYAIDSIDAWKVERKLHAMSSFEPTVCSLTLHIQEPQFRNKDAAEGDISVAIGKIKEQYRERYRNKVKNYVYDTVVHTGDNYEQNAKIHTIINRFVADIADARKS